MFTWELESGDLQIGTYGFTSVTGTDKIDQDLTIAALEPFGCDRFHARWGSLLNQYIGDVINPVSETLVRTEIARLVQNYMLIQQATITSEVALGLQSQYTTDEIVSAIDSITITQHQDQLAVSVVVRALNGQPVILSTTISGA